MSDATRDRLYDAVAARLAGGADREEVETCALAHLDAGPGYDDLAAAVDADPGDGAAADALAAYRMATRIADGRPVTATVGG